ncbi:MAG: ATP-binding protein [Candidatus Thermoplasmatota archaeon]
MSEKIIHLGGEALEVKKIGSIKDIETTAEIKIPTDPLERVIGQDEAVGLARIAAKQRRHFLLVGPPGTGKSMIAQALALHLELPNEEIQIVQNPENPERPFVEVKTRSDVLRESKFKVDAEGEIIEPTDAPIKVAERLGYRCVSCGTYSSPTETICPSCERAKLPPIKHVSNNPFGDLIGGIFEVTLTQIGKERNKVTTTRRRGGGEEVVVYERAGEKIKVLDQKALEKRREYEKMNPRKVLVPLSRNTFVLATGASETELLGDVRHDPYGGHPQLGTPPYERVVAGSIHEAHEGVLFIDELPHLGHLQRYILTAMQEKKFPIVGRNPQSAGASVRVDNVPCDFIFVGACNIQDLPSILSPLRSRINGSGYEILVEITMPDNDENRLKLAQFVAQEITMDRRIPHAAVGAVEAVINEARRRAKVLDGKDNALTLRLRELGGVIRAAGDLAVIEGSKYIEAKHIEYATKKSRTAEEQIKEKYGSYYAGIARDVTQAQKELSPYNYWNYHLHDDKRGYE